MRAYTPFSEKLQADGSNIAGVLAALDAPRKSRVERTLTDYLKALPERDILEIWTEPVGRFQTDAMLSVKEGGQIQRHIQWMQGECQMALCAIWP